MEIIYLEVKNFFKKQMKWVAGTMASVSLLSPVTTTVQALAPDAQVETFQEVVEHLEWNASKIYNTGDRVFHNGVTFEALWWTQNQEPGQNIHDAWMEIQEGYLPYWTNSRVFDNGDIVQYNGGVYQAQWWVRNQSPSQNPYAWESVEQQFSTLIETGYIDVATNLDSLSKENTSVVVTEGGYTSIVIPIINSDYTLFSQLIGTFDINADLIQFTETHVKEAENGNIIVSAFLNGHLFNQDELEYEFMERSDFEQQLLEEEEMYYRVNSRGFFVCIAGAAVATWVAAGYFDNYLFCRL